MLGDIDTNGDFTTGRTAVNADDGKIKEVEMRLQADTGIEHSLDAKNLHLRADCNGDVLIPLGKFSSGTMVLNWNTEGTGTSVSGQMVVSAHNGTEEDSGPFILSQSQTKEGRVRLRAVKANGGNDDAFYLYLQYDYTASSGVNTISVAITTTQKLVEDYSVTSAATANIVPVFSAVSAEQKRFDFNKDVYVNGEKVATELSVVPMFTDYLYNEGYLTRAYGANATLENNGLLAIGVNSLAAEDDAIALGSSAKATGDQSMALGPYAMAEAINTIAIGRNANATGENSAAFGYMSTAEGTRTAAIGLGSYALGDYSIAMGNGAQAEGDNATALGSYAKAIGEYSVSMGSLSTAEGRTSVSFGRYTQTIGAGAAAFGHFSRAEGDDAVALGVYNQAIGQGASAVGHYTEAAGDFSAAFGSNTTASDFRSVAVGSGTQALGENSVALGVGTNARADYSSAFGVGATTEGYASTSVGNNGTAWGMFATALGSDTNAIGDCSSALGFMTESNSYMEFVVGSYNSPREGSIDSWVPTDNQFVIGNGMGDYVENGEEEIDRSNALTILKNGRTTLTNKYWNSEARTSIPENAADASNGEALSVEGHTVLNGNTELKGNTVLKGTVTVETAQGDISMGPYGN